jgi:hypothetical protein
MINKIRSNRNNGYSGQNGKFFSLDKVSEDKEKLPEILFITTYPPREWDCNLFTRFNFGIKKQIQKHFDVKIAALAKQHLFLY